MGTQWGLGPFTIEHTTEGVIATHRLRLEHNVLTTPQESGSKRFSLPAGRQTWLVRELGILRRPRRESQ
jgi:hypothetical protein